MAACRNIRGPPGQAPKHAPRRQRLGQSMKRNCVHGNPSLSICSWPSIIRIGPISSKALTTQYYSIKQELGYDSIQRVLWWITLILEIVWNAYMIQPEGGTNRGVKWTSGNQRNQTHSHEWNRIKTIVTQHILSSQVDQVADHIGAWKRWNQRICTV